MKKEDLRLVCTCESCPEQYDVFAEGYSYPVGYIRFRSGWFTCRALGESGLSVSSLIIVSWVDSEGKNEIPAIVKDDLLDICKDTICQYFTTEERLNMVDEKYKEYLSIQEKEERKLNHILTMTLNSIEAAMLFLEDFESRVEKEYKRAEMRGTGDPKVRKSDRAWIANLSRAYKAMKKDMEGVRRQYTHFIEPQLNKVFLDKESNTYDVVSYDDHMSDANELARIILKYFDKAYLSLDNAESIEQHIDGLAGCGVMEKEDYKRYNLRR